MQNVEYTFFEGSDYIFMPVISQCVALIFLFLIPLIHLSVYDNTHLIDYLLFLR